MPRIDRNDGGADTQAGHRVGDHGCQCQRAQEGEWLWTSSPLLDVRDVLAQGAVVSTTRKRAWLASIRW
jgi:hypothetical protein